MNIVRIKYKKGNKYFENTFIKLNNNKFLPIKINYELLEFPEIVGEEEITEEMLLK